MEAAVGLRVGDQAPALLVELATRGGVLGVRLSEVVVVDEVVARVVGRVDVDELDLARVRLAHDLQRLEVVALDVEVLGGVPVDRLLRTGPHGLCRGRAGLEASLGLAWPRELVALAAAVGDRAGEVLPEGVEVYRTHHVALSIEGLGHDVRHELCELVHQLIRQIWRPPLDLLYHASSFRAASSACFLRN